MISRRLFLAGMLTSGVVAPSLVDARSLMPIVVPRIVTPKTWVPEPWILVPGYDYDGPWYEQVGQDYRVVC